MRQLELEHGILELVLEHGILGLERDELELERGTLVLVQQLELGHGILKLESNC